MGRQHTMAKAPATIHHSNDWSIDPKRLWRRYALALGILLVLVLVSHISAIRASQVAATDAVTINTSGQQRMLSQRVLYLSSTVRAGNEAAANTEAALDAINVLETSHASLLREANESNALRMAYFGDGTRPSLDTMLKRFITDARLAVDVDAPGSQAAFDRMRTMGPNRLLDLLQTAVAVHEMQAGRNAARLAAIHKASLVAAIVTLLLEALLIYHPAHLTTRRSLEALENKTNALETAQREVSRRNRQLAAMCDVAEHDAMHDSLTGLANRRYLQRELALRCELIGESEDGLALLQVDLDRFKDINDTLGHAAGDHILCHVADVMRECMRETDFIARAGGDEFIVLTTECDDRDALRAIAERLIVALSKPVEYDGAMCSFSASIGIEIGIECRHGPDIDADLLLSNADIALYRAKELGRNRVEFFTESMRAEVEESRALGEDIIRAIERDEFFPVYQVQVAGGNRAVHGVEALARWRHPEKGEIAPWRFLPVAARMGVTDAIDDAILRHALKDVAGWRAAGLTMPNLSVNVSAGRLADPQLLTRLREMAIPPGSVSFEVLESIFADKIDDSLRFTLDSLEEMGIAIEVDDFGTGHASLLALLSLRPSRLKIARELIDPAPNSPQHRAVLESIMQIAATLETEVVAEGIETEEHAVLSEEIGVQIMQGFHFCRPVPEAEAAQRIAEISAAALGADTKAGEAEKAA